MEIAVHRNFLFDARCGAKDFFEKQKTPAEWRVFCCVYVRRVQLFRALGFCLRDFLFRAAAAEMYFVPLHAVLDDLDRLLARQRGRGGRVLVLEALVHLKKVRDLARVMRRQLADVVVRCV